MKRLITLILIMILTIPCTAMAAGLPADGEYTVEAVLTGGSGRASVESPAALTVKDGSCTAVIVWSSPFYEWMKAGKETYYPIQTEGNATFEIPAVLDTDIPVTALTIAMSEPHEIEYTLRFDSATIKPAGGGSAPTIYIVLGCAVLAAAMGVTLVVLHRKKRGAE